jgi:hypothetical protein
LQINPAMTAVAHNGPRHLLFGLISLACTGCPVDEEPGTKLAASLRGDNIIVELESDEALYQLTCTGGAAAETSDAGTRQAPEWAVNAARPAPMFESEPIAGPVRVTVTYFEDEQCRSPKTATLELDVPEQGVCCPVGEESCNSDGPAGGWAPSLDQCWEWNGTDGEFAERYVDAHGCDTLRAVGRWTGDPRVVPCPD